MAGKKAQALAKKYVDQNSVEIRNSSGDSSDLDSVTRSLINESKAQITSAWEQLVGTGSYKVESSGEMQEGQVIEFAQSKKREELNFEQKQEQRVEAGWDYTAEIIHAEKRLNRQETHSIEQQIQAIIFELQKLIKSSKVLEVEFKEVATTEMPVNPGKYHVNFFEWVFAVIKSARMKVEDSKAWLHTVKGKGGKKDYWSLYKKHGTSFGLSGERTASNQTG